MVQNKTLGKRNGRTGCYCTCHHTACEKNMHLLAVHTFVMVQNQNLSLSSPISCSHSHHVRRALITNYVHWSRTRMKCGGDAIVELADWQEMLC